MRVLVACEESQAVCKAFRALGHEAYSCDTQECSGGHPEWHIVGDVAPLLQLNWDMIIAFPPCTYMCVGGAARMYPKKGQIDEARFQKAMLAKEFFLACLNSSAPRVAVENPTPMKAIGLPPYSQVIQPYEFGHPYSKRTCLWLKGLPPLMPTDLVEPKISWVSGGSKRADGSSRSNKGETFRDSKTKSKTFPGIAKAMANQWGGVM